MIRLKISMKLFPTEEKEHLIKLFNFFHSFDSIETSKPDSLGVSEMSSEIFGFEALTFLFTQVRKQRTVEAVRRFALSKIDLNQNSCKLLIHKQALTMGKIVLCKSPGESPLGPVYLEISANKIDPVIEYLFPPTERGRVLEVNYSPRELD